MEHTQPAKGRRLNILFLAIKNDNQSQMAEAFARHHGGENLEAFSAGSDPAANITEMAVRVMEDRGLGISAQNPKGLEDLPVREWDYVITMDCGDRCPHLPARNRENWVLTEIPDMTETAFTAVRNEIERRTLDLLIRARVMSVQTEKV